MDPEATLISKQGYGLAPFHLHDHKIWSKSSKALCLGTCLMQSHMPSSLAKTATYFALLTGSTVGWALYLSVTGLHVFPRAPARQLGWVELSNWKGSESAPCPDRVGELAPTRFTGVPVRFFWFSRANSYTQQWIRLWISSPAQQGESVLRLAKLFVVVMTEANSCPKFSGWKMPLAFLCKWSVHSAELYLSTAGLQSLEVLWPGFQVGQGLHLGVGMSMTEFSCLFRGWWRRQVRHLIWVTKTSRLVSLFWLFGNQGQYLQCYVMLTILFLTCSLPFWSCCQKPITPF